MNLLPVPRDYSSGGMGLVELSKNCRLFALQCFRWAAMIEDPSQHLTFTLVAREWLSTAKKVERMPASAQETYRAKLH